MIYGKQNMAKCGSDRVIATIYERNADHFDGSLFIVGPVGCVELLYYTIHMYPEQKPHRVSCLEMKPVKLEFHSPVLKDL